MASCLINSNSSGTVTIYRVVNILKFEQHASLELNVKKMKFLFDNKWRIYNILQVSKWVQLMKSMGNYDQ